MSISADQVAVADTEVSLITPDNAGRRLLISNTGANLANLGPAGVTLGAGYELAAAAPAITVELDPRDELFAISTAGATTLQVLRT